MSFEEPGLGSVRAHLVRGGDQNSVQTNRNARVIFRAVGAHTDAEFGLYDYRLAASARGAGPHYHKTLSESFLVLDGALEVLNGDEWVRLEAGELAYVPRYGIHGFRNPDPVESRFLILFLPGVAREAYFEALAAMWDQGREPTEDELDALGRQHDNYRLRR